jgi:hypothetical protein
MSMEWVRARLLENQARQRNIVESDGTGRWLEFSMSYPAELQLWLKPADHASSLPFPAESARRNQEHSGCQQIEAGSPQNRMT